MPTRTIGDLYQEYRGYSAKASDGVRTLAIAGIAAVWLFTGATEGSLARIGDTPPLLLLAGVLFGLSLMFDVLHYVGGAYAYRRVARTGERVIHERKEDLRLDSEAEVPDWLPRVPAAFFLAKIIALFLGWASFTAALVQALATSRTA